MSKAKRPYNRKVVTKQAKKKIPGEAWVSESQTLLQAKPLAPAQSLPEKPEAIHIRTVEDETVIQSLLDDIKGSFESQFEMDLDPFGNTVGPSFSSQDFGMTETFNLSNFDENSFDSKPPPSSNPAGVASVSSDAMFSGAGLVEDPTPGPWQGQEEDQEQRSWQEEGQFSQAEYLSGGESISQDQFLKMFDDDQ